MKVQLGQLRNMILKAMGLVQANVDSVILTDIDLRINAICDWIAFKEDWEWRRRKFHLTTRPPYETGTISITQGSRTVTGSGTNWTKIIELGYLLVNGKAFKIDTWVSSTSFKLPVGAGFTEDTISGATYKIVYPFYFLPPDVSSIIDVRINGNSLDVKSQDRLVLNRLTTARPSEVYLADRLDKDFYSTGTVTVTASSTSVVGSGTSWTSDMEGMPFQVNEFSEEYIVDTVSDTEHLTITKAYRGSTGSGKSYVVGKAGSPLIGLSQAPDDYYFVEVDTLISLPMLVNDTDISMIPNHGPIIHGVMYWAYSSAEHKNPVQIQQELANFKDAMNQLKNSYKVIGSTQWTSNEELNARAGGGLANFDPLNLRRDRF